VDCPGRGLFHCPRRSLESQGQKHLTAAIAGVNARSTVGCRRFNVARSSDQLAKILLKLVSGPISADLKTFGSSVSSITIFETRAGAEFAQLRQIRSAQIFA
jgi:hypothetical protein